MKKNTQNRVRVLLLDIETLPLEGFFWDIWNQNIPISMIEKDWSVLSWSAKWLDDPMSEIMYFDVRKNKDVHNDKKILKKIHRLLEQADIIIGHNVDRFDTKKLNARFLYHDMPKPRPYKTIDTLKIAKKHFKITSNKLEYLAKFLGLKQQKSAHKKFPGIELWKECRLKNQAAFDEMEKYNKQDVIVLEKVYKKLRPWDNSINFDLYSSTDDVKCNCGGTEFHKRGFSYTNDSKFQRFQCVECKSWYRGKVNLFSEEKRKSLKRGI